jgi:hypothetical protein
MPHASSSISKIKLKILKTLNISVQKKPELFGVEAIAETKNNDRHVTAKW